MSLTRKSSPHDDSGHNVPEHPVPEHHTREHHTPEHQASDHHGGSLAELLDLDAAVLHEYLLAVTAWLQKLAVAVPVRRILDIGAGTGTGTSALADRFSGAEVVAVDASADMLARVRARASSDGYANRSSTVHMDADKPWPAIGTFDVIWASASLHELSDPESAFRQVHHALNPGGLFVIVEMDRPTRVLEDEVGDGLESRIHDVLLTVGEGRAYHPDWTRNLEKGGFSLIEKRSFPVDLKVAGSGLGGEYAQTYLRKIHPVVARHLSLEDRILFDALIADDGPSSLRHRDDLRIRDSRTGWIASRA